MSMDEEAWSRHASPWSVYTRFLTFPIFIIAIWSRVWIGWWCLVPVALAVLWTWLNPRLFGPPASTDTWASKGTFGERVWLNRDNIPVPAHHAQWANGLSILAAIGMVPLIWGLWTLDPGWTAAGLAITVLGKTWFVDRMAWLYEDMKDADPAYRSWLR